MSNINELRELSLEQLQSLINDLNKEIFDLQNRLAMNRKLEKPHQLKDKKKDRARAMLVFSEKKVKGV